jgi:hypothetical protein
VTSLLWVHRWWVLTVTLESHWNLGWNLNSCLKHEVINNWEIEFAVLLCLGRWWPVRPKHIVCTVLLNSFKCSNELHVYLKTETELFSKGRFLQEPHGVTSQTTAFFTFVTVLQNCIRTSVI